ncbi:MAG: hypothetical protein AB8H03_08240 [Saprospiraceae bacterium]
MKNIWQKIQHSSFFVKWTNWEYYPVYIANIPTVFFWLYFGIRARALFFFSSVNPVIETGGVMGESKINIFNRMPEYSIPKTIFIKKENATINSIITILLQKGIKFPFIAKPDVGERGFLVEKIEDKTDLKNYLKKITVDFIIQDFIDSPLEISVLYYRMPDAEKGTITSVCIKKMLSVTGDGKSTIETLMENYPRAKFQLKRFQKDFPTMLLQIPKIDEEIILEPIGNHSRGTTFLNGNHHIDAQLIQVFDKIALQMEGIHYGRFDMKCESIELLRQGKAFKILEFNGIASEPAHIYDPKYSLINAYQDIFNHWKIIYKISKVQRKKGVKSMTWGEAYSSLRDYFKYIKSAKN